MQGNHIEHRPFKGHGVNNPGWGLSDNMTKIMSHSAQPDEPSLRASRSLVWAVAPRPNTADSIIRHRYDDPKTVAEPAKVSARAGRQLRDAAHCYQQHSCGSCNAEPLRRRPALWTCIPRDLTCVHGSSENLLAAAKRTCFTH